MEKGEDCILLDNTDSQRWRVRNSRAAAGVVPSICLTFPPPDTETKRKVTDLNDQFQAFIKLWKEKQSKLKLDMVFATMSVIKQWDSAKVWTKVSTGLGAIEGSYHCMSIQMKYHCIIHMCDKIQCVW